MTPVEKSFLRDRLWRLNHKLDASTDPKERAHYLAQIIKVERALGQRHCRPVSLASKFLSQSPK